MAAPAAGTSARFSPGGGQGLSAVAGAAVAGATVAVGGGGTAGRQQKLERVKSGSGDRDFA